MSYNRKMKTKEAVRFSIVIPCYNEELYIERTLISLSKQTFKGNYEVIIVDNNCTDNTVLIAQKYDVRVVKESTTGVCAARQAGVDNSLGEIIVSTDADTTFKANWLEKIDQVFNKNDHIVAVGGPCRYYDGPWWGKLYTHFLFGFSYLYFVVKKHPIYITATNIAFKKSYFEGYDAKLVQGGDEIGILHKLKKHGIVVMNPFNSVYTSGRRLQQGLIYSVFVSFIYYYLGAYYINSLFKKNVIGNAPAFRYSGRQSRIPRLAYVVAIVIILAIPTYMNHNRLDRFIDNKAHDIKPLLRKMF